MTREQKIKKAHSILSTVRNTVSQKLEEVDDLLKDIPPSVEGKKPRRNLREGRSMDFETQYKKNRLV